MDFLWLKGATLKLITLFILKDKVLSYRRQKVYRQDHNLSIRAYFKEFFHSKVNIVYNLLG